MSLHLLKDYAEDGAQKKPTAVCLGMFDGVHLGHQALISHTCKAALEKNLVPCAFTFDIPPACALFPERNVPLLTPIEEKSRILHSFGLWEVIYEPFGPVVEHMSALNFFNNILCSTLNAKHIVIGFHYHFGYKAEGNAEMMKKLCCERGISLDILSPVTQSDGTLISSTAIRNFLLNGQKAEAERMLNQPLSAREENLLEGKNKQ